MNRNTHKIFYGLKSGVIALLLMCCFSFQSEKLNDQTAKALFVYHFTKYVEWPIEKRDSKFVIGIFGKTDILNDLMKITSNKLVDKKEISIETISDPEKVNACNIVYIPNDNIEELKNIAKQTKNNGVLIVTETVDACTKGSIINIIKKNSRMVFEINTAAATEAKLKVSDQLLALAIVIK
jgi:hypothetical protein